jgi:Tfp pilus assembly protein PilF
MKKLIIVAAMLLAVVFAYGQPVITPAEKEGTDFYKQGKTNEAIVSFKKALVEKPQSLYSINALANLYLMGGEIPGCLYYCRSGRKTIRRSTKFYGGKS